MTTRPPIGAVLLTGLAVFVALTLLSILPTVTWMITNRTYFDDIGPHIPAILSELFLRSYATNIVLSLWVVLSFAFITPIKAELRMSQVVRRSLLTAAAGAVVTGIVAFIVLAILEPYGPVGLGLASDPLAIAITVSRGIWNVLWSSLFLIPLAGLLLWGWLRRAVPVATASSAPTQEVSA